MRSTAPLPSRTAPPPSPTWPDASTPTFVSILTLLFDLSAIASIGSAVALVIFMMVGIAHLRLIKETGANRAIIYLSIISVVITLLVFSVETLSQEPATAIAIVVFLALSVDADSFWRFIPSLRGKRWSLRPLLIWAQPQTSNRGYFPPRFADISLASTIRPGITTLDRCE